jgi:hypothetical protein
MRLGILCCFFLLAISFDVAARTLYSEINRLRVGDGYCAANRNLPPLQPQSVLERVARSARGDKLESSLQAAAIARPFHDRQCQGDFLRDQAEAVLARQRACRELQDGSVTEVGIYIDSRQFWIVMAAPLVPGGAPAARFSAPVPQYRRRQRRASVSGLPVGHRILDSSTRRARRRAAAATRCSRRRRRFAGTNRSPYLRSYTPTTWRATIFRPRQRPRRLAFMGSRRARRL